MIGMPSDAFAARPGDPGLGCSQSEVVFVRGSLRMTRRDPGHLLPSLRGAGRGAAALIRNPQRPRTSLAGIWTEANRPPGEPGTRAIPDKSAVP